MALGRLTSCSTTSTVPSCASAPSTSSHAPLSLFLFLLLDLIDELRANTR